MNGGSSRVLQAGESGGLGRQVSGFEPGAQQQRGSARAPKQRHARGSLGLQAALETFLGGQGVTAAGVVLARTPRDCHRKQMRLANGKHTSLLTKTPEIQEKQRGKDAESPPPLPRAPLRRPSAQRGGRFTFVAVCVAVRVEVISIPQPAHLRHLGN